MATLKSSGGGQENKLMSAIALSMAADTSVPASTGESSNLGMDDEDDDFVAQWERKRLEEMKQERVQLIRNSDRPMTGDYREIVQDEFLPEVTSQKLVVCHFSHAEFQKCRVMDQHLQVISREHPETKFLHINSEKAPFFIARLAVKVLPTVVVFVDGVAVDRIVGFEGITTGENFPTLALTRRLVKAGGIIPKSRKERGTQIVRDGEDSSSGSDSDS